MTDDSTFPRGRFDLLRPGHPGMTTTTMNGLRLWAIANDLPWPLPTPVTVDNVNRTITLAPTAEDRERLMPLTRVLRASLWRNLVAEGGVWCAHAEHRDHGGADCPRQVNQDGNHAPTGRPAWLGPPLDWPPRAGAHPAQHPVTLERGGPLDMLLVTAIHRAAGTCQHPDPGQPIYESDRACANCAAAAVLALFDDAYVLDIVRTAGVYGRPS